jgi:transposase
VILELAAGRRRRVMALSDDLRKRVVDAVLEGGMSRNAAAKRFGVGIASAIRWVWRFQATGEISPAPTGGDRRSNRIEAHRDYLLGLIRRQPDITLLEIQERLIANNGERFSSSVIWRFFDRHEITFKKRPRMPRSSSARTSYYHFRVISSRWR